MSVEKKETCDGCMFLRVYEKSDIPAYCGKGSVDRALPVDSVELISETRSPWWCGRKFTKAAIKSSLIIDSVFR